VRVLLTTEGTYPYGSGGVSTWAHALVGGLERHEFTIAALVANPHVRLRYQIPPNAQVLPIPMWGAERVDEYLPRPSGRLRARRAASRWAEANFLPAFSDFVDQLLAARPDAGVAARALAGMGRFSLQHDLRAALRHEGVWPMLREKFLAHPLFRRVPLADAVDLARSLYRYLMPLALPLPPVDVAHSSAAAFCTLPALLAKFRDGAPLVVTEHGMFLRERWLQLAREGTPAPRKLLLTHLYQAVLALSYTHADVVAPVCDYNQGWERHFEVDASRLRVIPNGVDPDAFPPSAPPGGQSPPTVAFLGNLSGPKDVLTLIAAAAMVREEVPGVVFRLYGPDNDPGYARRCRDDVAARGLSGTVVFEGKTSDAAAVYRSADVMVLSSVTEGFPFTVVEAMMSARPVVATAVGGISEALGDPELLVEPRRPDALARALVRVLRMPYQQRDELGRRLHGRAREAFSRERFLADYDALYGELHARAG
jgi:glycosyltransferase involved in cell wall biosynthesis